MSYILDALKKAEAERRTGSPPSLHTTPHTLAPPRVARAWWQHPATWIAGAALLLAAGTGGWLLTRGPAVPTQLAAAPADAPAAPAPVAAPITPPAVPPAASKEPATPAPAQATSAPPPAEPPAKPAPVETKPPASAERKPETKPKAVPRKAETKAAPTPSATRKQEQEAPVPPLRELPEQIQREIPPLQIGGYIYSPVPADRSVLINKRLLREGDEIAPDLKLEKMTPSGMVLNFRGHRYRSGY